MLICGRTSEPPYRRLLEGRVRWGTSGILIDTLELISYVSHFENTDTHVMIAALRACLVIYIAQITLPGAHDHSLEAETALYPQRVRQPRR